MTNLETYKPKKKTLITIIVVLVIFGLLPIVVFWYLLDADSFDIYKLEMEQADIPKYWNCEWIQQDHPLDWELNVINDDKWYESYVETSNVKIMAYQWIENSDYGGVIHLAIVDYRNSAIAKNKYLVLDPSLRYGRYFENFGEKNGGMVAFHDKRMNEDAMQCGSGLLEMCNSWYYRAIIDQYYLFIHMPGPLCVESFKQIVVSINNQFFKNIQ